MAKLIIVTDKHEIPKLDLNFVEMTLENKRRLYRFAPFPYACGEPTFALRREVWSPKGRTAFEIEAKKTRSLVK